MMPFASHPDVPKQIINHDVQTRRLDRLEKTAAAFLLTDVDLAMTLTRIASGADENSEKRIRNQANARHAYDDVSRIGHHALLTDKERQALGDKLSELRSALERLGEDFA